MVKHTMITAPEGAIKSDPNTFFGYVDLKKNDVGYPSVMHF
jgi:hypothetical protein